MGIKRLETSETRAFLKHYLGGTIKDIPGGHLKRRRLAQRDPPPPAPDYIKPENRTKLLLDKEFQKQMYKELREDTDFIELLKERNNYDYELYELAQSLYQDQIEAYGLKELGAIDLGVEEEKEAKRKVKREKRARLARKTTKS